MNILVKIINSIIISINRILDNFNIKTKEIIKNSFYGITIILLITGIFIGYNKGKGSARKFGKPLTESTNEIFATDIKKEQRKGRYKSMIESEMLEGTENKKLKKVDFPANEIQAESVNKVIEPESYVKKKSDYIDKNNIAEVDRTDEKQGKPDEPKIKKDYPTKEKKQKINKQPDDYKPMDKDSKIIEK